jgi:S1-C subfamily serine protease
MVMLLAAARMAAPAQAVFDPRDAVVKIYVASQPPNFTDPWTAGALTTSTSSGCILSNARILTNAHVVTHANYVQVRRHGQSQKYEARVLFIAHDADLALLTVDDRDFFEGVTPLSLGTLPAMQSEVAVHGFPQGGDTLSTTRGVISRTEHQVYVHSSRRLLAGQIDAAINFGNSGGPVMVDNQLVGIAMQLDSEAQNIAYMVPVPVIAHVLDDAADGTYHGFPELGLRFQGMESAELRRRYRLPGNRSGVRITLVAPGSAADGVLRVGDVLMAIGNQTIANDGTVEIRPKERTLFSAVVERAQVGQTLEVAVWRQGQALTARLLLKGRMGDGELVMAEPSEKEPTYFIFGGLVFCPLTLDYLKSWGEEWTRWAPPALTTKLDKPRTEVGEEVVVLSKILSADVNEGYHDTTDAIVIAVDGVKPRNLRELTRLLEGGTAAQVVLTCEGGSEIALDRAQAKLRNPEILRRYHIASDRSTDIQAGR